MVQQARREWTLSECLKMSSCRCSRTICLPGLVYPGFAMTRRYAQDFQPLFMHGRAASVRGHL